jgi:hypothetical protein
LRTKKAFLNSITSLTLQIVTIVCGFILPRLIIQAFGSSVNGLTASISQFLGLITIVEGGLGGLLRSAFYKPLAFRDHVAISRVYKSSESFFRKIAYFFIIYLLVLAYLYPGIVTKEFDFWFTFLLVLILGISIFVQYFYGITNQILLNADQKLYVSYSLQIIIVILNTILGVILIRLGANIFVVKSLSTLLFIAKPTILNMYVKHNYSIDKNAEKDPGVMKQKWDALGHHIAFFIHSSTDIVLLTMFTNTKEVSVYAVYLLIVNSVLGFIVSIYGGIEAAFGNLIANNETSNLRDKFDLLEFLAFNLATILFTSTALLIVPFVSIYTKGVTDVNYSRPLFAYIIIAAQAIFCIRLPYSYIVVAAGHFKQTRNGAIVEAILNIGISIGLVFQFGLVGVALGTLVAMLYRTFNYVFYLSKEIINRKVIFFIKRLLIAAVTIVVSVVSLWLFSIPYPVTFISWLFYAFFVTTLISLFAFMIGLATYKKQVFGLFDIGYRMINLKSKKGRI